jgi:hypothetical protein
LLTASEIKAIYDYPLFSDSERQHYFYLSRRELAFVNIFKNHENKIYFILMLGYFKAKTIFYKICFKKSRLDLIYINKTIFAIRNNKLMYKLPSKNTIIKIKQLVYELLHIDSETKRNQLIYKKINDLAKYTMAPINIFKDLLSYLKDHNIPIPAYTSLQTLIGNAILEEETRLTKIIDEHFPQYAVKIIDNLLIAKDGLYPITALKSDPKGFSTSELQGELDKHHKCSKLFIACKNILPKFNILKNNIAYYASLAIYYNAYRLLGFPKNKKPALYYMLYLQSIL